MVGGGGVEWVGRVRMGRGRCWWGVRLGRGGCWCVGEVGGGSGGVGDGGDRLRLMGFFYKNVGKLRNSVCGAPGAVAERYF